MEGGTANSMLGYVFKSGKFIRLLQIYLELIFSTVARPVLCAGTEPVVAIMGSSAARAARWEKITVSYRKSSKSCSRGSSRGQ